MISVCCVFLHFRLPFPPSTGWLSLLPFLCAFFLFARSLNARLIFEVFCAFFFVRSLFICLNGKCVFSHIIRRQRFDEPRENVHASKLPRANVVITPQTIVGGNQNDFQSILMGRCCFWGHMETHFSSVSK